MMKLSLLSPPPKSILLHQNTCSFYQCPNPLLSNNPTVNKIPNMINGITIPFPRLRFNIQSKPAIVHYGMYFVKSSSLLSITGMSSAKYSSKSILYQNRAKQHKLLYQESIFPESVKSNL